MAALVSISIFLAASAVIWFFSGILIEAVVRVAERFQRSGFSVAFFVLGFLTSVSELSVAVNATINGVPHISVGNLAGASFVILLFIIPFLAVIGRGIDLKHTISRRNIAFALALAVLPVLLTIDGDITRAEGILALLAYFTLAYAIQRQGRRDKEQMEKIPKELLGRKRATFADILKIAAGGAAIFIAAHFMVEETIYFAAALGVPGSLMGLLLLSVGTNVPEIVVAARAILKKRKDIAFGDYLGSAVANTAIFGLLALVNGRYELAPEGFMATMVLMLAGLVTLYLFARSKNNISRREGLVLLFFYAFFLVVQIANVAIFSGERL
jgi:cation:H+ antiporter